MLNMPGKKTKKKRNKLEWLGNWKKRSNTWGFMFVLFNNLGITVAKYKNLENRLKKLLF